MKILPATVAALLLFTPTGIRAGCCEHTPAARVLLAADATGDYRIVAVESVLDDAGRIETRFTAKLNQALKGDAPAELVFRTPGGRRGNTIEISSLGLNLVAGDDCILHLRREADGGWKPLPFQSFPNRGTTTEKKALRTYFRNGARGRMPSSSGIISTQEKSGIPGSRLTATGYFQNASGVPYRHITCDSGLPIPCLIDIDPAKLPAGTDTVEALAIVQDALDAWSEVSSLKFRIEANTTFGVSSKDINTADGKLRIQLHDNHNAIPSTSTLGIGGSTISGPGHIAIPGSGATIAGRSFLLLTQGYVVLNHRATSMADPLVFAEVLTHEIGHALGLTHSSGNPSEPEPLLADATMYYASHADGRGAAIRAYDEDRILFGYPLNTPPYSTHRVLRAVIANTGNPKPANAAPTGVGVDRITVTGGDLQGSPVTVQLLSGAEFNLDGNIIRYTALDNYSDIINLSDGDIARGQYYHQALFTLSDGVNQSAIYTFNITGFHRDSFVSDGLPNSWLQTHFGDMTVGPAGSPRHPLSDPDGDGLNNRTERYLGTNPIDPKSGPAKLAFDAATRTLTLDPVRFAPYAIEASPGLGNWNTRSLVASAGSPATLTIPVTADAAQPRMFYRARLTP
jgi:hypothetical protein